MIRIAGSKASSQVPPLRPIRQASTPALIARQLREAIADGRFEPGQQLLESSLATALGVSRGPLREAMQRLTQEGLLVGHRNRGLFVMDLDEAAVRDIYVARSAVERAAIEYVVESGRGAGAAELLDITAEMARRGASDGPDIVALDMMFHQRLVALTESPRLMGMHDTLLTQVRLCLVRMQATYSVQESRAEEHAGIAQAVLDEDVPLALDRMRMHMDDGLRRVLLVMDHDDVGASPI